MATTDTKSPLQQKFFEKLKLSVPANISLANEIADVLEISADGAYRRMRGESILSMDEMVKLCRHYKVAPDFLAGDDESSATFHFKKMIHDEKGFGEYIKNILSDLQKINASDPKQIIYAAGDLPLFIQFLSPEYSAFKTFFWQKAMLSLPSLEGKKFSPAAVPGAVSTERTETAIANFIFWRKFETLLQEGLSKVTLKGLLDEARRLKKAKAASPQATFQI